MEKSMIICDNDFLSAFLWIKKEDLLLKLFEGSLYVPDAVKNKYEILKKSKIGYFVYEKFNTLLNDKKLELLTITVGSEEEKLMFNIRSAFQEKYGKVIGDGELEMITLAISHNASFTVNTASNNLKDIAAFIAEKQISNITTMDVLCLLYEKGLKNFEELEEIKKNMLLRKRNLPSISIKDYYNNQYKKVRIFKGN